MARLTPEQAADKLIKRLKGATEDIRMGVDRVTEAPSKKAIAAKERMKARLIEALDKGKWERGLGKYTLEQWKADMKEKGIPNISRGIERARDKLIDFYGQLFPYQDALKKKIEEIEKVDIEDSIRRVETWIRGMHAFEKK